jgi:hypothetical protein
MKCLFFKKFKYYTSISNIAWFQSFESPVLYDIVFFHNFSFKLCIMYITFYFKCLIRFSLSLFFLLLLKSDDWSALILHQLQKNIFITKETRINYVLPLLSYHSNHATFPSNYDW